VKRLFSPRRPDHRADIAIRNGKGVTRSVTPEKWVAFSLGSVNIRPLVGLGKGSARCQSGRHFHRCERRLLIDLVNMPEISRALSDKAPESSNRNTKKGGCWSPNFSPKKTRNLRGVLALSGSKDTWESGPPSSISGKVNHLFDRYPPLNQGDKGKKPHLKRGILLFWVSQPRVSEETVKRQLSSKKTFQKAISPGRNSQERCGQLG